MTVLHGVFDHDERQMLITSVKRFCATLTNEEITALDEAPESGVVEKIRQRLDDDLGLHSALLSQERGGLGCDDATFFLAVTEVARASAGLAALLVGHNLALWILERSGGQIAAGHYALAYPFRSDSRTAPFVPGAGQATHFVWVTQSACYCVARDEPQVTLTDDPAPLAFRAARPGELRIQGADIEGLRVGALRGDDLRQLEARVLLGSSAIAAGTLNESYARALAYARERYQGGRTIIGHPAVRLMLASMAAAVQNVRALIAQATCTAVLDLNACRAAKVHCSEAAGAATTDAVQVLGGYGYMRDYGVERQMREAAYCRVFPRPNEEEMLAFVGASDESLAEEI